MAKRQPSITLSFVLLRFAVIMLGCMLLCGLLWMALISGLQTAGFIYHGSVSNQQAEEMLKDQPAVFAAPDKNFLPEYALFDTEGAVLETNAKGRELSENFSRQPLRICTLSGILTKMGVPWSSAGITGGNLLTRGFGRSCRLLNTYGLPLLEQSWFSV